MRLRISSSAQKSNETMLLAMDANVVPFFLVYCAHNAIYLRLDGGFIDVYEVNVEFSKIRHLT